MSDKIEIGLLQAVVEGAPAKRRTTFQLELRRISETCASRGIAVGALVDAIFNAGMAEADSRLDGLVETIKRNVLDTTYEVSAEDVLWVFDNATLIDLDLRSGLTDAMRASGITTDSDHLTALTNNWEYAPFMRAFCIEYMRLWTRLRRKHKLPRKLRSDHGPVRARGINRPLRSTLPGRRRLRDGQPRPDRARRALRAQAPGSNRAMSPHLRYRRSSCCRMA